MHANSKVVTAPKVMVLNGEQALLSVTQSHNYESNATWNSETVQVGLQYTTTVGYWTKDIDQIQTGIMLLITPTITFDKKYVILNITAFLNDELARGEGSVKALHGTTTVEETFDLPQLQYTNVMTRVTVPDQGTVLLGGLTLTAEQEIEAGVPVLSKIPVLGRLFSNRSEVKRQTDIVDSGKAHDRSGG